MKDTTRPPFLMALVALIRSYLPRFDLRHYRSLARLLPTPGNVLFTLLVVVGLFWASSAGAFPLSTLTAAGSSTSTIAYQGRLADTSGTPLTGSYPMIFRLYSAATGGSPLWEETWSGPNSVQVSDGLFNVMLGSLTQIPQSVVTGNSNLWLGITVGSDDEMLPRVQLGTVPFAVQALTVPDGSITPQKLNINANLDMHLNALQNVTSIDAPANGATQIRGDNTLYPGTNWPKGGWIWIRSVNSPSSPGSVRVHIAKDASVGNSPTFDILRIQDDGQATPLFSVDENGNQWAKGSKSALVQTNSYGYRKLYAVEAPDVRFSDEGLAHLQGGVARVTLDPVFLETIESDFLITVTPYGDSSLYVAEVGKDYFVIKSRDGDPNVAFVWRLSAHRKGYAAIRMEQVDGEAAGPR